MNFCGRCGAQQRELYCAETREAFIGVRCGHVADECPCHRKALLAHDELPPLSLRPPDRVVGQGENLTEALADARRRQERQDAIVEEARRLNGEMMAGLADLGRSMVSLTAAVGRLEETFRRAAEGRQAPPVEAAPPVVEAVPPVVEVP